MDSTSLADLLSVGRRNLAVRDYNAAAEALAKACEELAKKHGDTADQCAEAYLWYGKSLLGLSRDESGVLGDGMPGANTENDDDNEEQEENGEEDGEQNGKEVEKEGDEKSEAEPEQPAPESTVKDDEPGSSKSAAECDAEEAGTSNGDANEEEANLDNEDEVENLQLAWEMLELSRNILLKRVENGGGHDAKGLLADVHLALGEVALESETYDKAVVDMQSCLELQKELYSSNDRRIAETHYQIGLANSLASNFEDAITHFKNAANILETRIKTLETPSGATEEASVKKFAASEPAYSVESEIKELKELLPEIQEKIQDMMDYKAETIKRVRETLCPSNGEGSSQNGASSSTSEAKPAASDISHLIKRKRKSSETETGGSAPKRANT